MTTRRPVCMTLSVTLSVYVYVSAVTPFILYSKGKELGGVMLSGSNEPALAPLAQISDATAVDFYSGMCTY